MKSKRNDQAPFPCDHLFAERRDGIYCEAGGFAISQEWLEHRCAKCDRRIEDIYEEEKERANGC